jgi:hypothetical protein
MAQLPSFNATHTLCLNPHVVILGAGASLAACPNGDINGRVLPLMDTQFLETCYLREPLQKAGVDVSKGIEEIYSQLADANQFELLAMVERKIESYFSVLNLSNFNMYDKLLLSLQKKDFVATFNWDPLLAQAYIRQRHWQELPTPLFLHGNVMDGFCLKHKPMQRGFIGESCQICHMPYQRGNLHYPVQHKNYQKDKAIIDAWTRLENALRESYMVTIYGYSAPATDVEAKGLLLRGLQENKSRELAQIEIIDVKEQNKLLETWSEFIVGNHVSTCRTFDGSWLSRFPRRTCEALDAFTLSLEPKEENPMPGSDNLQGWLGTLIEEEQRG